MSKELRSSYITVERCKKCAWFNRNMRVFSTSCCPECGSDINYVKGRYVLRMEGFLFFKQTTIVGFEPWKEEVAK